MEELIRSVFTLAHSNRISGVATISKQLFFCFPLFMFGKVFPARLLFARQVNIKVFEPGCQSDYRNLYIEFVNVTEFSVMQKQHCYLSSISLLTLPVYSTRHFQFPSSLKHCYLCRSPLKCAAHKWMGTFALLLIPHFSSEYSLQRAVLRNSPVACLFPDNRFYF